MSKKLFIIIVSVTLGLLLISLLGYYFILQNNGGDTGNDGGIFQNFFPFGGGDGTDVPVVVEPTIEPPLDDGMDDYIKRLRKLSSEPVAGFGVVDFKAGSVVRHIEKATGHIFETELFSPNQRRISNTTIPMVYDAIWGNKNNSVIARYLKADDRTIDTYGILVKETASTTDTTVSAIKFIENLVDVSVFGSSVFSLERKSDSSVGYISNFDNTKRVQIWSSPIKEVLSQYVNGKTVSLTTKPEENTDGFMFFVDTGNAQVRQVLGNILGLSTNTNDLATQVLLLNQGGSLSMSVFDIKNKTFSALSPTTFPEKCVWSKKDRNVVYCAVPAESIDSGSLTLWYKGFVSFADNIWKYDIRNNTSSVVGNLFNDGGEAIDVIKPSLSESEQYLIFINKTDNSLWSLDLTK